MAQVQENFPFDLNGKAGACLYTKRGGSWVAGSAGSSTATVTVVTSNASSTLCKTASPTRSGLYVYNDSTYPMYLKYGSGASTTSFTVKLDSASYWEMPTAPTYLGALYAKWSTAGGFARVTEI